MELLAITQGWYGERIVRHVASMAGDWHVEALTLRKGIPPVPEEEEARQVVRGLLSSGQAPRGPDLLLLLAEEPGAVVLLPELAQALEAEALICPGDDYRVLPRGLERQLADELEELGILFAFPRPFCSLSGGPGPIGLFAQRFGMPEVELELDGDVIRAVRVLRGAPCGSTHYMARKLVGVKVQKAPSLAGLSVQTYPCLASHVEDPLIGEDMIHVSASLAKAAVERALARLRRAGRPGCG